MLAVVLALSIGIVAGLRAMTALAAVSWAAYLGLLELEGSWLVFLAHPVAPWVFTVLAVIEFVTDQLPSTPSRTKPIPFGTRMVAGGLSGAAIGISGGILVAGLVAGIVGAVIGTLGGHAARARLAATFGRDRPAALLEDAVAIAGAFIVVALA